MGAVYRFRAPFGTLVPLLALLPGAACADTAMEPEADPTHLGTWLISRNAHLWGVDGGSFEFGEDGTVTLRGAAFADDGYTTVERSGTWTADASFATATLRRSTAPVLRDG